MVSQKTLVLDIELAPMEVYAWALKDQYVGIEQIIKDSSVIAWGAKWFNEPISKLIYKDNRNAKDVRQDAKLLLPLWELLDEADIIITQNGEKFDAPKLNSRFIIHGMKPPSPYKHLDTYKIAKKVGSFTSNKLSYLTANINKKYKKLDHSEFPGLSLWKQCLAGNMKAWEEMKEYNIHDVLSTEELYTHLRAWNETKNTPRVFVDNGVCGACDSSRVSKRGLYRTVTGQWQRLKCEDCGKWALGEKVKP